jgi:integrase/recombinase XerD
MLADLQLKGITPQTQKKYLREVSNLAKYFGKSPEELGEKEVKEYLVYLLEERKLSRGTYRNYVSGIKFFYKTTLNREEVVEKVRYPKDKKKLPCVFDLSEVKALLFGSREPQAQGYSNDHVFCRTQDGRNCTVKSNRYR